MASDIDNTANETYFANYGIKPRGDIYDIPSSKIPDFDLLCAGFPCQPFSQVGPHGGFDDIRGLLIFEVIRILRDKKPKAFILENVKGLRNIQKGKPFEIICEELRKVGYKLYTEVLEAKDYGTPQLRKRLFFVGIRNDINAVFEWPKPIPLKYTLSEVMQGETEREYAFTIRIGGRKSGINNRFNWDCYRVDGQPRYITPQECLLLQGFPKDFKLCGIEKQQFSQVGNSVSTFIIQEIAKKLVELKVI